MIGWKELYYCNVCGNVLEAVYDDAPALVCCNKLMKKLIANTEDLGKEKHVPVVESLDGGIVVKVGSIGHNMVEKISGKSFDNTDFFQLAKGFPFGIVKMAEEMVVRDLIALDGSRLICVGEVPLNSFVYILKGDKDSLIAGAAKARQLAEASYWKTVNGKKEKPLTTFFADCVSRVLFLQSDFNEELEAVYAGYPLLGALTIGEIANTGKNYIEFYNKTSVIGLLED